MFESLWEYGLAWRQVKGPEDPFALSAQPGDYEFIYRARGEYATAEFATAWLPANCQWRKECRWVAEQGRLPGLLSFLGITEAEFDDSPLERQVEDLLAYFGAEEVFGTAYYSTKINGLED